MTVYEAVVSRLAMLGYTVTDNDETGLNFLIDKCEKDILAKGAAGLAFLFAWGYGGRGIPLILLSRRWSGRAGGL